MATFSQSTVAKGSESKKDFCCSSCLENKIYQLAEFYCENCPKFYCAKCINLHGQLFGNHVTYGRGEISKWPVSKEVEDFLQKCDLHGEHLKIFCNNHSQLCCSSCAFLNHRQCKVTLISESVKGPPPDLQQLSRKIQTILEELKTLQNIWDTNMQSLQASHKETLQEIRQTRQNINTILDKMEATCINELDDKLTDLKSSLKTDMDNCCKLKNELKQLSDAIHDIVDKGKAELSFIASKKCLEKVQQFETYLTENSVKVESSLIFQANRHNLSKLSDLGRILVTTRVVPLHGNPDQVFNVHGKAPYDVRITRDSKTRFKDFANTLMGKYDTIISAVCVLSNDQILVADHLNKQVRLLNHQYQVVGNCNFNARPNDMCKISPSEVAVAVEEDKTYEVQFFSLNGGELVKGTKLRFRHKCHGVARNLQDLYLTSGTALYKYSMSGDLLSKLYEDTSGPETVERCAVSPSGDKIFVINYPQSKVLTLARDGKVLHTFTDPDLKHPRGIHVTPLGQVLVCGGGSHTILQLDGQGKKKLATLATKSDGIDHPLSVCYNWRTGSIIVGQYSNNILVFTVK